MDIVAGAVDANLFYTRLQGHGRSGKAMGEATVEGWINDLAEAEAIGRRIGERMVLVGTSTGGTLTDLGSDPGATVKGCRRHREHISELRRSGLRRAAVDHSMGTANRTHRVWKIPFVRTPERTACQVLDD